MVGAWIKFQLETTWSRNLICGGTSPNNVQGILTITLDIYSFFRAEKKNGKRNITQSAAYEQTLQGNRTILEAGYNLVVKWSYEKPKPWWNESIPQKRNETFPHSIVFDFEAFQDVSKRTEPTPDLIFESEHEPVSVSLADTLNREPEHICSKELQELVRKLREILKMRGAIRGEEIRIKCFPEVIKCLSKPQQSLIEEW